MTRKTNLVKGVWRPIGVNPIWSLILMTAVAVILTAADQTWQDKEIAAWTVTDAKQLLTDSPWSKTVTPTIDKPPEGDQGQPANGGRRAKKSRRGGAGTSSTPNSGTGSSVTSKETSSTTPDPPLPKLTLRWESALPIREAELKAPDAIAPAPDGDHYTIAVYGFPNKMLSDESKQFTDRLRALAIIKRDGKQDVKPYHVEILLRQEGAVLVYRFQKNAEFSWRDGQLNFTAQVGQMKFTQSFPIRDMIFHGALEL